MRVVAQRVTSASVTVNDTVISQIGRGLLLLVAFTTDDSASKLEWMADKLTKLRVFDDADGVMNQSVIDTQGTLLVVSQFTLYGDVAKGTRPSYIRSAPRDIAIPLYEQFIQLLQARLPARIACGEFGADMQINLTNDGPVTIILEK